jgi:cyclophilin family peptidyl-prolyl cis-trans isomerase
MFADAINLFSIFQGDPAVEAQWREKELKDDPVVAQNVKGTVSFATAGPDTRTSQIFINLADNSESLDSQGFAPIGEVILGMDIVEQINAQYGAKANQASIISKGNTYLDANFPDMSYIISTVQSFKPV